MLRVFLKLTLVTAAALSAVLITPAASVADRTGDAGKNAHLYLEPDANIKTAFVSKLTRKATRAVRKKNRKIPKGVKDRARGAAKELGRLGGKKALETGRNTGASKAGDYFKDDQSPQRRR